MMDIEVCRVMDENSERIEKILKTIYRAGEAADLVGDDMHDAGNFRGCSLLAVSTPLYKGEVLVSYSFGRRPDSYERVEIEVKASAENLGRIPYLHECRKISKNEFPILEISFPWLVIIIKDAVEELWSMCTPENFYRLKRAHDLRNGVR